MGVLGLELVSEINTVKHAMSQSKETARSLVCCSSQFQVFNTCLELLFLVASKADFQWAWFLYQLGEKQTKSM